MDEVLPKVVARNLGLHLLVGSSQFDLVAICLHPLGLQVADYSHDILAAERVPVIAPDRAIALPDSHLKDYRRLSYEAARRKCGQNYAAIAAGIGISPKTLQNWRRKGLV